MMASALISLRLYLLSLGAGLFHCYTPNPSPKSPKKKWQSPDFRGEDELGQAPEACVENLGPAVGSGFDV